MGMRTVLERGGGGGGGGGLVPGKYLCLAAWSSWESAGFPFYKGKGGGLWWWWGMGVLRYFPQRGEGKDNKWRREGANTVCDRKYLCL